MEHSPDIEQTQHPSTDSEKEKNRVVIKIPFSSLNSMVENLLSADLSSMSLVDANSFFNKAKELIKKDRSIACLENLIMAAKIYEIKASSIYCYSKKEGDGLYHRAGQTYGYAARIAKDLKQVSSRALLLEKAMKCYFNCERLEDAAFASVRLAESYHYTFLNIEERFYSVGSIKKRDKALASFEKIYQNTEIGEKPYYLYRKICKKVHREPIPIRE